MKHFQILKSGKILRRTDRTAVQRQFPQVRHIPQKARLLKAVQIKLLKPGQPAKIRRLAAVRKLQRQFLKAGQGTDGRHITDRIAALQGQRFQAGQSFKRLQRKERAVLQL